MKCFTCMGEHDPDDACAPVKREVKHGDWQPSRLFEARYDGDCAAECGVRIREGDTIRRTEDGYAHEGCA